MPLRLEPPFVLLEDRTSLGGNGRLFRGPAEVLQCNDVGAVRGVLERVQAGLDRGLHAAGFLAYEAGQALEPRLGRLRPPRAAAAGPLAWFGLFEGFDAVSGEELDDLFGSLAPPPPLRDLSFGRSREAHVAKVEAAKALIAAGDLYQVNLTFPIRFRYEGDALALYAALRAGQPVAHGGVVASDDAVVLSVSPELFVSVRGGRVETRPMKGTAARGANEAMDLEARRRLVSDPKQRAENVMIVDLLRNDLSRICKAGSVRVPELYALETYPTFHTLTSTVCGDLKEGFGLLDVLTALFPCGSVVGAPKIRAAEIINEFEEEGRGVYTGAVGAAHPGGDLAFNVAIRTAVLGADGAGRFGVGGGIVADSDPAAEYEEARLKGRVLTELADDFQLIETLRWSPSPGFVRLEGHLDRLTRSAWVLGFELDRDAVLRLMQESAETWRDGGARRVRLLLGRDGSVEVSGGELGVGPDWVLRVGVFDQAVDAADPFLRHKTTRRGLQDAASAAAAAAGLDEMILLNRRGRVADGSRTSVFVRREGRLLTPAIREGALPGVLRAELITGGAAAEAVLTLDDLKRGPFLIGNSLRGLQACILTSSR